MNLYSDEIWKVLACPYCRSTLQDTTDGAKCSSCDTLYGYSKSGALDLRLRKPKSYKLEFQVGSELFPQCHAVFKKLPANPNPEVDFSHLTPPWHLTRNLLSYFPKAKPTNSLMLDLGCGSEIHREVCELAGFQYVGLDYDSTEASILGDAHALSFKDECFQFVLSIAVIEHIKLPHIMMREVYRVLKPHGQFIGTVAFLEPYHGMSYYHHSHLGLYSSLQYAGFDIDYVAPSDKWTGLRAQTNMGLFPRMPQILWSSLIWPIEILHRIWWRIGRIIHPEMDENKRLLNNTASLSFVARKN